MIKSKIILSQGWNMRCIAGSWILYQNRCFLLW